MVDNNKSRDKQKRSSARFLLKSYQKKNAERILNEFIESIKFDYLPGFEIVLRSFDKQQFWQKVYEYFFHPWLKIFIEKSCLNI